MSRRGIGEWRTAKQQAANADMVHRVGVEHGNAKLTTLVVIVARRLHAAGLTITALAEATCVDRSTMADAIYRKTWRHVP